MKNFLQFFTPLVCAASFSLCSAPSAKAMILPVVGPPVIDPGDGVPVFNGAVSKLKITKVAGGNSVRVKATITLANVSGMTLRGITATAYLSANSTLDPSDTKLVKINLGEFYPKNKIGKGETRTLHLNRKVPTALAALLEGKYLIVDLQAANATGTGEDFVIAVGPIKLP